jgi:hypothetical protein
VSRSGRDAVNAENGEETGGAAETERRAGVRRGLGPDHRLYVTETCLTMRVVEEEAGGDARWTRPR